MQGCRKRVEPAAAVLTDGEKQAVIQGERLKVVIEKEPFRIMVYDKDGSLLHATFLTLPTARTATAAASMPARSRPMTASTASVRSPARSTRPRST